MSEWNVSASQASLRTVNPIRALVDSLNIKPNPDKSVLKLSLGDPTVFGNLPYPKLLSECIIDAVSNTEKSCAGYVPAHGTKEARAAIATHWANRDLDESLHVDASSVCIASGCSHALQIALAALCDPGSNVVLPRPGFSVYQTICAFSGVDVRHYDLDPERHWEVDMASLAASCDENTRAILINNPSNPCGSVYSREHLLALLAFAEERRLPIIADEVYAHMAFGERKFVSLASLSTTVPVLSCGGLAKQFLVPGWRVGWLVLHDRNDVLKRGGVLDGVLRLSQVLIGANTLTQAALPRLLADTPADFHKRTLSTLERNATVMFDALAAVPALRPIAPQGAMYMMVGVDVDQLDIADDKLFCELLFSEESVFVLPGQCFQQPNYFRVVLCPPEPQLIEAAGRIAEFCTRHTKKQ
eukprot:TRINITY_DN3037_c0_g1_i1.p2 TRINITY_DN3037_c0_g1~~TRINITY_DN3037_c0_g1_i1.p2  ORF type:complete len:415 (-),score=224.52 TRINITY_DN3037_c0_g1_i1:30-1274(-)